MKDKPEKLKSRQQEKAMHKMFGLLADDLNELGLTMRVLLKPEIEIPWDKKTVKDYLWRGIQKIVTGKESTTELTSVEVDKVFKVLEHYLGEKHGVEINFPNIQDVINEKQ